MWGRPTDHVVLALADIASAEQKSAVIFSENLKRIQVASPHDQGDGDASSSSHEII